MEPANVSALDNQGPGATIGGEAAQTAEPRVPFRLFALKHADTFIVADANGNVVGEGDGMFRDDTRVLSYWMLTVGGKKPALLSASVSQDNILFTSHLTNRPLPPLGGQSLPQGVIHVERQRLIFEDALYERITLSNFGPEETQVPLELEFDADFRDMFEVRGVSRRARGELLAPEIGPSSVCLCYRGLDGVVRQSCLSFSRAPRRLADRKAEFTIRLRHGGSTSLYIEIAPQGGEAPSRDRFRAAAARARFGMRSKRRRGATAFSPGRVFNDWIEKSRADLALLTTELKTGPFPYAGIPWFSTPFGRDAIITSLQMLWLDPSLARGVLAFLAANQAKGRSAFQDSAPGKIMHETRKGEMVALDELPFGLYYGGVDTTPLFVMLAGAYAERTADLAFIEEIWPALLGAMGWIEGDGDSNGDGFVDYMRAAASGLANQGWKDSQDSIFHADGSDPAGPIALIEVQGYCYAAFRAMAMLAARRGDEARCAHWNGQADRLRDATEARFWMHESGLYALALDGNGRPCRVRSSNSGQLLYTGLPSPERARAVIDNLLTGPFNSGWGIRTLAEGEARYNPMSYHNGSVWPHDTALCAAGMARYGERAGVIRILDEMFEAAVRFEMRLPELYCGFERRGRGDAPVAYPVACLPQAWASGSLFMLLQAALGISVSAWREEIRVHEPRLPTGIETLEIRNLAVGKKRVSLSFQRVGTGVVAYSDQHFSGLVPIMLRA
ncbi:MAG TPA: amylo-alpha-1,6-glucosidase [Beijerinckiaceae bacterium]|nr:amylo-alpha-1,6-glucosidase [Beijerinckiaceae bacterium]